eukprot:CAMPEP_0195051166 /NCGR_PEP_ID=MMETSP0448-20130528/699_1 /TAXON_ID=66468 /ORGANISM="Heterocapsa triquestra, Strain CCMP 448" /LENGTH=65 /DNA_ID=CAMNT_0040080135 /DNA_START=78 /DNA_END=272 /DNA_ORIENTATION=+
MAAAQTTQAEAVAPPACDLETNSVDDTSSTECSSVATPVKAKDLNHASAFRHGGTMPTAVCLSKA